MEAHMVRLGVMAALTLLATSALPAKADLVAAVLGCTGDPCVVRRNPGGIAQVFIAAADAINSGARKRVIIDGVCASACAILADRARRRVCVTNNAVFAFHMGRVMRFDGSQMYATGDFRRPQHSRDIRTYVQKHGGFPREGFVVMRARDARAYWRSC
jgi:hypothetical protein